MKGTESQRDGAIVIVVIVAILFAVRYSSSLFPSKISDIPFGNKGSGPLIVGITGSTGMKGVFYIPEKAKVSDLLEAAGIADHKILDNRTLSKRLSTGKTVVIESRDSVRIEEMKNAYKLTLGIPIDINTATIEDLMLVDGIGERTAAEIVQYRERSGRYHKVEDLMKVRGIKEKKFGKLRRYFSTDNKL